MFFLLDGAVKSWFTKFQFFIDSEVPPVDFNLGIIKFQFQLFCVVYQNLFIVLFFL